MSINLFMLPFVLTARVVMGKEKFEEWVKSSEESYMLNKTGVDELEKLLMRNGYDFIPWGNNLKKSHFKDSKIFFFLELIDGSWNLVLSKDDSDREKTQVLKLFNNLIVSKNMSFDRLESYLTNFSDSILLKKTLIDCGINYAIEEESTYVISEANYKIILKQEPSGYYRANIETSSNFSEVYGHLNLLDNDYKGKVQEYVYHDVKNNINSIKSENVQIEIIEEYIDEDDSIVLRLRV